MARVIGTAYKVQMPPSFNKLCKHKLSGLAELLNKAQNRWVSKMKDYRDCFVHYTPVDTLLGITANLYSDGWEIRCKLPINPNAREILLFKFSRRVELLRYSISTFNNMMALDKAVAKKLKIMYDCKEYPVRINNLFFIGSRNKPK